MKKLIIAYLFTITNVFGAPPTYFNGELQTNTYIQNIKAPNYQTTPLGGIDRRLETGNLNELQSPNFEHSTVTTGWNISNATASGNTSAQFEGKKSISLVLTGALSLSQSSTINAARKSGVQMVASVWVNSSDVSDLQLCSLKNGAEDKCTVTGGYVQGSGWRQLTVSFIGNATSNGLKLKSTDTTGTVLVDQAFVGVGSPIVDFTPDMVYSAEVKTTTGAVTKENIDFIASCTAANPAVCTFNSGIFTTAPNCTLGSDDWAHNIKNVTATGFSLFSFNTTTAAALGSISAFVTCVKTGADYKTSKAYVASSSDYGWTSFTPTSPNSSVTFSSSSCYHSKQGQNLLIRCYGVSSASTASEARISLPNSLTSASNIPIIQIAGDVARSGFSSTYFRNVVLIEPSVSYLTFGRQDSTVGSLTKTTGALAFGSDSVSFTATIPIQGWENSSVIVGSFQGYNETPGTSRPVVSSVQVAAGTKSTACTTGSCTLYANRGGFVSAASWSSAGTYNITLNPAVSSISETNCVVSPINTSGGIRTCKFDSPIDSTSEIVRCTDNINNPENNLFTIMCHGSL